jgi:hypothetical protein
MNMNELKNLLNKFSKDFSLFLKETPSSQYNVHYTILDNNLPNVDLIEKNLNDNILILAAKIKVSPEHYIKLSNQNSVVNNNFLNNLKKELLLINVEYTSYDEINKIPTTWDIFRKIHVDNLNIQSLWDNYLIIKNAAFLIILNYQQELDKSI